MQLPDLQSGDVGAHHADLDPHGPASVPDGHVIALQRRACETVVLGHTTPMDRL